MSEKHSMIRSKRFRTSRNDNTIRNSANQKGFTMPELVVSVGVFAILAGGVALNISQSQHHASINAAVNTLLTDIRQQQVKTMTGDTQSTGAVNNYGIYFQTNSYTLFHGASYVSNDSANFTVNLDPGLQFANDTFSGTTLMFDKGTGEMLNYTATTNSIKVKDTLTGQTKTITINRYGVITQVN